MEPTSDKLRRKPEAVIKSFEMDPTKKAVYVEGPTDRLFFEYLFEDEIKSETLFYEIDTVDIPAITEGGKRQRLIEFAKIIDKSAASIKIFIDADFSRIISEVIPKPVILTDFRDLEAYLYEKKYLTKFIKLGLKTNKITPDLMLDEIHRARDIAILRLGSYQKKLDLPFQETNENFSRYYTYGVGLDFVKYVNALIQNCKQKHKFKDVKDVFTETQEKQTTVDNRDLIHGKDVIEIVKMIAAHLKLKKENVDLIFWMSFDKADIKKFKNLKEVGEFVGM